VRDPRGSLPLHLLVSQPRVEFGTVAVVVDAFPESMRVRDPRGLFPVHVAAASSSGVHIDVVYRLARACPEALLNLGRNVRKPEKDARCGRRPRKVRRMS
jgi:hypothetical protein